MISEEERLLRQILELATLTGWRAFHMENATSLTRRRGGAYVRKRNVNPQGVGFPDLVLVNARRGRLIFAELKGDLGPRGGLRGAAGGGGGSVATSPEQDAWLADLRAVALAIERANGGGISQPTAPLDVVVWRPADWPTIERELAGSYLPG